jgi:hypothetical protein
VSQRTPQSHGDRWILFRGLIDTAESASTVSLTPLNPLPRSHWNRGSQTFLDIVFVMKTTFLCKNNVVDIFFYRDSVVSFKPPKPLLRSHWNHGSRPFQTNISNFSANSKTYAKRLWPVNQGPRVGWLMKKTKGLKSLDTFLVKNMICFMTRSYAKILHSIPFLLTKIFIWFF